MNDIDNKNYMLYGINLMIQEILKSPVSKLNVYMDSSKSSLKFNNLFLNNLKYYLRKITDERNCNIWVYHINQYDKCMVDTRFLDLKEKSLLLGSLYYFMKVIEQIGVMQKP